MQLPSVKPSEKIVNYSPGKTSSTVDYVNNFGELSKQVTKGTMLPPSILMAQAILESGGGKSGLTTNANNHFGIKGNEKSKSALYWTKEDGQDGKSERVQRLFRVYDTPEESFAHYASSVMPRYVNQIPQTLELLPHLKKEPYYKQLAHALVLESLINIERKKGNPIAKNMSTKGVYNYATSMAEDGMSTPYPSKIINLIEQYGLQNLDNK